MTAAAAATTGTTPGYRGNDRLLLGIVLAVLMFWLFAGSAGTVAPAILADVNSQAERVSAAAMNLAVSITALCSGLFIVLMGGLADRFGRVKVARIGIVVGMVGAVLLVLANGMAALPLLLVGRALQGLSAACIMPSTMALVKSYWDGAARQRAVSMWSIGSWGGSGLSALFGGALVQFTGWRGIFIASIAVGIASLLLFTGVPESRAPRSDEQRRFDTGGFLLFVIGTLSMMIVLLFGRTLGWTSVAVLALAVVAIAAWAVFVIVEKRTAHPFIDFGLFTNTTFTGATISNFLVNGTIGMLMVSQQLIQLAGRKANGEPFTAWDAGLLTIGYAVFIIGFIRVGEKLLQRFGPRRPMIWGSLITIVSCLLLMGTNVLIGQYVVLAIIAYCLFGLGLAFYATPSTDAALSNLPAEQVGAGSGIYKMASSLGSAIGAAVSLAVFTGLAGSPSQIIGEVVRMEGRQDNIGLREAALVALGVNLVFLILAILSIVMTVPKGGGSATKGVAAASAAPTPQATPDEEREEIIAHLSQKSLSELRALERHARIRQLEALPDDVLERLLEDRTER